MYSIVIVFGSYKCCRMCLQKLLTTAVDSVETSLMNEVCFVDLCSGAKDFIFFPTLVLLSADRGEGGRVRS